METDQPTYEQKVEEVRRAFYAEKLYYPRSPFDTPAKRYAARMANLRLRFYVEDTHVRLTPGDLERFYEGA